MKLLCLCCLPILLAGQDNLKTTVTQRYFNGVRRNLEAAAEIMPAAKYDFKLTDGQMSFAEWINHSTERNYADCATLKGEPAKKIGALKEKAEVTQALKDSFAYCAAALESIDDQKVLASPQMTYALLHIVVHNNEIYGNLAGYLRSSSIVPPSTASRMDQKGKKYNLAEEFLGSWARKAGAVADPKMGKLRFLPSGRFVASNVPLYFVIATAWNLPPVNQSSRLSGAPEWL